MFAHHEKLAVPFSAFTRRWGDSATCLGLSDGSPWKIAAALFSRYGTLLAFTQFVLPFSDIEGLFQNVREYMGFILVMLLALSFSNTSLDFPARVAWVGDNKAALSWVDTGKAKSSACQLANIAGSWLGIQSTAEVAQVRHLSASRIGIIDSISRDKTHDFPPHLEIDLQSNPHVQELFRLLDPTKSSPNLIDHQRALASVVDVLTKVTATIPRTVLLPELPTSLGSAGLGFHPVEDVSVPPLEEGIYQMLKPTIRPDALFGPESDSVRP